MFKIVNSDIVIGNYIIEMLERGQYLIDIDNLFEYDSMLAERLKSYKYVTRFDYSSVVSYLIDFSYFVKVVDTNKITVIGKDEERSSLLRQLKRKFRIGLPKVVVNEIIATMSEMEDVA